MGRGQRLGWLSGISLVYLFILQHLIPFPNLYWALAPDVFILILVAWVSWPFFLSALALRFRRALFVSSLALLVSLIICGFIKAFGVDDSGILGTDLRAFVYMVLYAPIFEETVFRFALWLPLEARWGPRFALVTTSIAFSLMHLSSYFTVLEEFRIAILTQGAVTFAFALVIGSILIRTRSLSIAMLGHAFANLGAFIVYKFDLPF